MVHGIARPAGEGEISWISSAAGRNVVLNAQLGPLSPEAIASAHTALTPKAARGFYRQTSLHRMQPAHRSPRSQQGVVTALLNDPTTRLPPGSDRPCRTAPGRWAMMNTVRPC